MVGWSAGCGESYLSGAGSAGWKPTAERQQGAVLRLHLHTAERIESMNFILWLLIGGILGWIASLIMGTDAQQGAFLNIVVGVIGALLAGFLLTPLLGVGTINQNNFSLSALFVSLLGAVILLAIVNLFRRGTVR